MVRLRCTAWLLVLAAAVFGCGDDDNGSKAETQHMQTPPQPAPPDAGMPDAAPAPGPAPPTPAYHLDVGPSTGWSPASEKKSPPRILRLTLRSTPPGATALVDGVPIGSTPTYWEGPATGKPRNFVFTLPGHNMARYRFVPTTDGVVHATLKKLAADLPDAGPAGEGETKPPSGDSRNR